MARLTFRQGIVSHQSDTQNNPTFLNLNNDQTIDLVVSPEQTIVTFIHGDNDYLFTENSTILGAWGPLPTSQTSYIYWDLDLATGLLTRNFTTLIPIVQPTAPTSPVIGQMWFNTTNNKWFEYTGSAFVEVVRVFAAKLSNGVTLESMAMLSTSFKGTQVPGASMTNITTARRVGSLVYGRNKIALRNTNTNTFFTTEDDFVTGVPTSASHRLENTLLSGKAQTNLAAFQVIQYDNFNKVTVANPANEGAKIFGIIEEDVVTGQVVHFTTEGVVNNPLWDFVTLGADANDPVYIDASGQVSIANDLHTVTPIGYVVGAHEIFFAPRLFQVVTITNGGGSGATAQQAAAIIANTTRSQTNQIDIDILNTTFLPAMQDDIDLRVYRAGDTMTGELVIDSTFVVNSATNTGIDVTTTDVEVEGSDHVKLFTGDSIVETSAATVALSADAGNSTLTLGTAGTFTTGAIVGLTASSQFVTTVDGVVVLDSDGALLTVGAATEFLSTVLLASDPTLNLQAATKQYVDNNTVDTAGDTMDSNADITFVGGGEVLGLPSVASGDTAATSKKYVDDSLATSANLKVNRAGDTMTGDLIVNALLDVNSGTNTGIATTATTVAVDAATSTTLSINNVAAVTLTATAATHTKATDFTSTVDVTGATTLLNTLDVTGATELLSTLDVTGATTLDATLDVIGAADFSSTMDVTGATTLLNTLDVTGATELLSTLDVTGFTTLDSTLGVIGAADFSSTLDVTGATELLSTLDVTGATTLDATLDVIGAVDFSSTLDVTGATTLLSTLNVTGATEFQSTVLLAADPTLALQAATMQYVDNEITAADDLNVNKAGDTMTGDLIINAQLDVNAGTNTGISTTASTVVIDAAANIDLNLAGVAGTHFGMTAGGILMQSADNQSNINITDTTFSVHSNGVLTVRADGSMDLSINGVNAISLTSTQATHTKATDFTSTVDVTGATTLLSTVDVTGATTLLSTLDVTGATDLSNTLDVTGATTLLSTLDVTGATELLSTLDVTGATTVDSTLSVVGAADFSSTVLLAADPTLLLQAATKQYVDNNTVDTAGDTMDSNADITFVGGGEVLGLPAVPSGPTAAASMKYVDDEVTALTGTVNTLTTDDLTDVDTSSAALLEKHVLFWNDTDSEFQNRYAIKSDITDFTETDYVHRTNPETIGGEKTFDDDAFFDQDVTITGNLTVNGTETVVNTNNLAVSDNVIVINDGETGSGVALGFAGMRIDRGTATDARFVFNETAGTFKMGIEGSERNVVSTYQAGFVIGDWTVGSPNSLTITAAVHKLPYKVGEVFHVQVYELSGGILSLTTVQTEIVAASGNVTIKTVGAAFAGSIVISK